MKKRGLILIVLTLFFFSKTQGQIEEPVKWSNKVKPLQNNEALLVIEAKINPKWHLYSQFFPEGGPMRLSFQFKESKDYKRIGKVSESPNPVKKFDDVFEIDVQYFSGQATFTQKIGVLSEKDFVIKAELEGQACNDVDGSCVPLSTEFEFKVQGVPISSKGESDQLIDTSKVIKETIHTIQPPDNIDKLENKTLPTENQNKSVWGIFLLAFVFGLAGVLMPCVYPMIPMTVSFFMQGQKSKFNSRIKALIFGISIVLLYTSLGLIVSLSSAGADFASDISSHWIPNLIFFLLFVVFAASFFGMFEIVLPSGLANKADRQVDKGGYLASFFMAFTLVIVSFSCIGPIVGGLLVKALAGEVLEPLVGMFGFGLGFALPFTMLAIIPRLLNSLPKSGGWMNSLKVVFGFIILAFSLKFVSNINQSYHLGILSRDVYLAIWIVLFVLLGFYFLGKIKFSHDSDVPHVSVPRLVLAIVSFTFALYMFPGLFGAELNSISALIPPKSAQQFDLTRNQQIITGNSNSIPNSLCETPKYSDILQLPKGLQGYFDYEQGMACAKKLNKPVMLDFKGHRCANCKEMEAKVWSNPEVLKRLQNDFIIIALYVDDMTELPEKEWITSDIDGKVKKTIGKKNGDFQISKYRINSQPYYVLVDTNGNMLNDPVEHDLNTDNFIKFLDSGLEIFKQRRQ